MSKQSNKDEFYKWLDSCPNHKWEAVCISNNYQTISFTIKPYESSNTDGDKMSVDNFELDLSGESSTCNLCRNAHVPLTDEPCKSCVYNIMILR